MAEQAQAYASHDIVMMVHGAAIGTTLRAYLVLTRSAGHLLFVKEGKTPLLEADRDAELLAGGVVIELRPYNYDHMLSDAL
jgi:hypothetical protein